MVTTKSKLMVQPFLMMLVAQSLAALLAADADH